MTTNLPKLIVFGEALTDFIREDGQHWRSAPGGSCWNVARVGARLGVPTGFAGTVSHDTFGDELMQQSAQAGLDMRFTRQVERAPFLAMVVSKHPPQYFFIGENSADLAFQAQALPSGWLEAAQIVHFGSLSLARQPLAAHLLDIAQAAHAAGKRISFDPNYRDLMAGPAYRSTLRRMAGLATYIKVSDEDLCGLFPELDEASALAQLREWAPAAAILVTRGAAGMQLFHRAGGAVSACLGGTGGRHRRLRRRLRRRMDGEPAHPARCAAGIPSAVFRRLRSGNVRAARGLCARRSDEVAARLGSENLCIDFDH